jgi:hypothetical protein
MGKQINKEGAGFYFRLQVKPTQLDPIYRVTPVSEKL